MLHWLRARESEHPLERKDDAQRLLGRLADKGPFAALEEMASYLDEVKTAETLKASRALEIVELLDRSARPILRKLTHEYLSSHRRLTRFQQHRLWFTCHSLLGQLAEGYQTCLARYHAGSPGAASLRSALPRMAGRALRAYGGKIKWTLLHYGEVDPDVWLQMGRLYAMGEILGYNDSIVTMYRGERAESSPVREFLRPLMLFMSAPHSLPPLQVELVDRITAAWADAFVPSRQAREGLHYAMELNSSEPPGRVGYRATRSEHALFFGPGDAIVRASKYTTRLQRSGQVPAELNLGFDVAPHVLLTTLEHLQRYWWPMQPRRAQPRVSATEQMRVAHDYDEVSANAGALFLDSPFVSNDESWALADQSDGGCGLVVPKGRGEWLRVGSLVAARPENGTAWRAGIVRRIVGRRHGERYVGVQYVGRGGCAVTILPLEKPRSAAPEGELCVLLAGAARNPDEAALLLRPGMFSIRGAIEMRAYDRRWLLEPVRVLESGEDFEICVYRTRSAR
ncbi:MAG: hypothetical protein IT532_17650 [Burkholderiales bacterium]|nr:hypothetical protein [Burkholderiales bacterium]